MKKRINLLSRKKRFDAFAVYAKKVKQYGTVLGIILFILFIFVVYQMYTVKTKMNDLSKKKQQYLDYLLDEKDTEANIRFFKGKETQLNKYLQDDAQFVPYYSILTNALKISTESATLDTIEIDKNRDTQFVVRFNGYDSMISFLKYVESDDFLSHFDKLSMASLTLTRDVQVRSVIKQDAKSYQLNFTGTFKKINDQ